MHPGSFFLSNAPFEVISTLVSLLYYGIDGTEVCNLKEKGKQGFFFVFIFIPDTRVWMATIDA
jgi:hypothetical protein